jgi:hypothetical protein
MRLGSERIAEKNHCGNLPFGDPPADDQVAAVRPVRHTLDIQPQFPAQAYAGITGRHQSVRREELQMFPHECRKSVFHSVVRD